MILQSTVKYWVSSKSMIFNPEVKLKLHHRALNNINNGMLFDSDVRSKAHHKASEYRHGASNNMNQHPFRPGDQAKNTSQGKL